MMLERIHAREPERGSLSSAAGVYAAGMAQAIRINSLDTKCRDLVKGTRTEEIRTVDSGAANTPASHTRAS